MKYLWLKKLISIVLVVAGICGAMKCVAEIELITNPSNPIERIDIKEVRALFSMRVRTWENQKPVHVFVLEENNPVHQQFCKDILKIFPHQLQAGWDRLVFSGTGEAPKVVASEAQMIEAIRSTPGSIGYISKQESTHENVKVIHVE